MLLGGRSASIEKLGWVMVTLYTVLLSIKYSAISRNALLTQLMRSAMHSFCPRHQSHGWLSFVNSDDATAGQVHSHDVCVTSLIFCHSEMR